MASIMPRPEKVYGMCNCMCTKGFLNYFSVIIEFLKVVFKGEIIKFSKNCGTFVIKESGGVKVQIMEF